MTDLYIDLNAFPAPLRRIVESWYRWQAVYLHKMGNFPLDADPDRIPWGTRPPTIKDNFCFLDDGEISYFLVDDNGQHYIDKQSRSSRGRYWMFRRFEDAEKYALFLISQLARPGKYTQSPSFKWYKQGLEPSVTLTKPDPENYPGRVSLTVDHETTDRGWMGEHDAIAASHVIVLDFERLEEALREGIPSDWFSINVLTK